jgi:drug/metabolite transporter (DMT)-like permease
MDATTLGELAAIGTAFLWTLSALSWTSAGKHIGAVPVSFIRMLVACVYLSIYGLIFRHLPLPTDADAETWLLLGCSGFFGFFIADVCLFKAFLLIGPRLSLLLQTLSPPLAQIIAWIFIGDKLAAKDWIGMAVTLLGVFWVVMEQPERAGEQNRSEHFGLGIFLASISTVAGAIGAVLAKIGIGNYDPAAGTYIRVLGAIIGYLLMITILRRWVFVRRAIKHRRAMSMLLFGSFVGPFLGVTLFMFAMKNCHVGVVTTIVNTMPVLILPFVIILYHEKVSLRAAGGALLSVAGVAIMVI